MRLVAAFLASLLLVGCGVKSVFPPSNLEANSTVTVSSGRLAVSSNFVDFGFDKFTGSRRIDTFVIHTARAEPPNQYDKDALVAVFKKYNVASHYVIDRKGIIFALVDEQNIAHHAGKSKMPDGREGVNTFSIGVELINAEDDTPTLEQYESLARLTRDIKTRHNIKFIVGHKDIAPNRKSDPWNFDFTHFTNLLHAQEKLAQQAATLAIANKR